ncbi:MAG TPA: M23 family metallopeptidase [Patescibacteria group bacterium]|nr:M23 family metallopeptidase [Patescibacteria group bacterium]
MAQFIQPRRRPSSDRNDDNDYNEPLLPSSSALNPVSEGAQSSLDNIDDVLRQNEENPNLFNPSGDSVEQSPSDTGAESPESLGAAEAGAANNFNFNPGEKGNTGTLGRVLAAARGNKKKALAGGGIAGAIIGFIAIIFFMLIPLKIEHIVQNLQNRFFATSENAVQGETQKMFTLYIERHVLPGYQGKCGTTIDSRCSAVGLNGTNPVSNLYKSWANAKLENKLATKYGIEFKYDKATGNWYLKAPGTNGNGDNIGPNGEGLDKEFQKANRASMRSAWRDAMQNETKWKQMYYRFKVGRLLEEKYGIRRCLIFCGVTDPLKDNVKAQKQAAKLFLTDRVITPRNKTLGVALTCLFDDTCDPTKSLSSNTSDPALAGSEQSATETEVSNNFKQLAAQFGIEDAEALQKTYSTIADKGYLTFIVNQVLSKLTGQEIDQTATDKIPVVGWINLGDQVYEDVKDSGPKVKKLAYITNADAAVSEFSMYRTYADEIHTGHVSASEVGSLVDSLGPGNSGKATDAIVGGTAGAEGTPLYAKLIDNSTVKSSSKDYKCNDGNPVPTNKFVCSEEILGQGNDSLNAIHHVLTLPVFQTLNLIADIWHSTVGKLFQGLNFIIGGAINLAISSVQSTADATCHVPIINWNPYCKGRDLVHQWEPAIIEAVISWVIPNPFSTNMGGGRTFDMLAAGTDVTGNDSAHTTLGGRQLTPQQTADIINQQQEQAQQDFVQQPLFARMFSTDSQYSLVSKVAMATPLNFQASAQTGLASFISNPFASIFHGFGSIFSTKASADLSAQADPFGVTQYGYTQADLDNIGDPEAYWNQYCSDNAFNAYQKDNSWNDASANTLDPNNEMPVNTTTNPCLLIKSTVGSAGGLFDSSLLTQDDLGDVSGSSSTSSSGTTNGLVWPFATKDSSQYNRIDQGWDIQDKAGAPVYAIACGTLNTYNPDPGGFGNDYPVEHLDSSIGGPSDWVYYGHVHIIPSLRGQHVSAGQLIAYANTTDPQNGSNAPPGWLEIGFAQPNTDAPVDSATAESVVTQSGQKMHDTLISATPGAGQ